MKNSQKGFVIPLLVIAALVIGAGTYFYYRNSNSKLAQDELYKFEVTRTNTNSTALSSCENIKRHYNAYGQDDTDDVKGSCYENLAIANTDISLCDKISDSSSSKGSCRYNVSVKKQDLSLCDTLPNQRSTISKYACYAAIGSDKHDQGICNMIPVDSPGDDRSTCVQAVTLIKGDCDVISGMSRDYCYLYQSQSVRVSARDNRCDIYSEVNPRKLCEKYVSNEITVKDDCGRIADISLRQQCVNYNLDSVNVIYSK